MILKAAIICVEGNVINMTEVMLREKFDGMEWLHFAGYDKEIREGAEHSGMPALIDLASRK